MNKVFRILFITFLISMPAAMAAGGGDDAKPVPFKESMKQFPAEEEAAGMDGIWEKISYRAEQEPFLLVATIIFILAITHTFFAVPLTKYSHKVQHDHDAKIRREKEAAGESARAQDRSACRFTCSCAPHWSAYSAWG